MKILQNFWIKTTIGAVEGWIEDKALRLGAALAFFSMFSIAPLVLIVLSLAGLFFDPGVARTELQEELGRFISPEAAETMLKIAQEARLSGDSTGATIAGLIAFFFGASGVFGQLQDALNYIWSVEAKPEKSWLHLVKKRLLSFGMILVIGFLLLVSLALSTLLSALTTVISWYLDFPEWSLTLLNMGISFAVITILFGLIFKIMPDAHIRWRDVAVGAIVTAALFVLGKFLLAWYLGRDNTTSAYGAAGAFVLVLLWVYYSSLILFFGAEFTKMYVKNIGSTIEPDKHAVKIKRVEVETG